MSERNGQLSKADGEEIAVACVSRYALSGADLAADTGRGNAGGAQADRGQHREHATLTEPAVGSFRLRLAMSADNSAALALGKRDAPIPTSHKRAPAGGRRVIAVSVRERA